MAALDALGSDRARRRLRWLVPVGVVGLIFAGVEISAAASSSASPSLPPRTAQQLIAAVAGAKTEALSGQISEVSNFGLPSLPGTSSDASLTWQSYLTGSHTVRIWVNGPEKQRIAVLGELSESDVIHNGTDLWTYTSDTNAVSHSVFTGRTSAKSHPSDAEQSPVDNYDPASIAARILKAITPSTAVSVDPARTVAGRATYTLDIRPRDTQSTVREVTIAIDAKTSTPLRVQIFGAGSAPALSIGFTSVSFHAPSAATFNFHPPAGASVSTDPFGVSTTPEQRHHRHGVTLAPNTAPASVPAASPTVIGTGWTSVVELHDGSLTSGVGGTINELSTAIGTTGERLLHTALLNAVVMPDGRAFVGAVSPALLEHIAATTAH